MISDSALFLCLAFFNNQSDSNSGILFGIYSNMLSFFFLFFFGYRVKSQSFFFFYVFLWGCLWFLNWAWGTVRRTGPFFCFRRKRAMMAAPGTKTVSIWISSPGQIQLLWHSFDICCELASFWGKLIMIIQFLFRSRVIFCCTTLNTIINHFH